MRVILVFDPDYGSHQAADLGDAFWLVRSPANSKLAEGAWVASDPNSALFEDSGLPPTVDDVEARLRDIDLHHPDWTEIRVIGFEIKPTLRHWLSGMGVKATAGQTMFSITR